MKKLLGIVLTIVLMVSIIPTGLLGITVNAATTSGTTGACTWSLNGTILTISGKGTMENYSGSIPWGQSITEVFIEDGVSNIGNFSFYYCTELTKITIPDSVTSIGEYAFYGCIKLENIPIPDGVITIGGSAASFCDSLTSITIPDSVTSMGEFAFGYCNNLKSVFIGAGITNMNASFAHCSKLESVIIRNGVTNISDTTFYNCAGLTKIYIPDSINYIGDHAFYCCKKLTDVYYTGNQIQKNNIFINYVESNPTLMSATWHYNTCEIGNHTYNSNCDETCGNCAWVRTTNSVHTYYNSCDIDCDLCGFIRNVTHSYNWIIDKQSSCSEVGYKYEECLFCFTTRNEGTPIEKLSHTYTNSCDATCNVCNEIREIEYDYKITTDESITLQYKANTDFYFTLSDESIAEISGTSTSMINIGGYISKTSAAIITPLMPGYVLVQVKNNSGYILSESMLFVEEGKHQMIDSKVLSKASCTKEGKKLQVCKFCDYEKEVALAKLKHTYTNACDASCNVCKATRTITHTYSNNCDKSCNVCGKTRTVGAHKYTNSCDTTCNYCGAKRTIKHTYTNNCDTSCNVCKAKRTIKHTYSNNCDTSCNVCKATRTITHTYKTTTTKATTAKNGSIVKKCTVCGKVASNTAIKYAKTFKLSTTAYTYNGGVKTPSVTVKDSAGKTISSKYYTVSYSSGRKNAGTYKVTVTMKGNYSGTKTLTFKINPAKISSYKLSATTYTYDGKVKTPNVTVKNTSGVKLTKNTHYTVTYASGRKNVGTYKVTIKGKGNYTGTKTLTFKINPAKTTVSKLTAGKKSITVAITKKTTQVTGYQIQYSTSKTFSKATTKTISSYKTTKYTLKSLSAKKTYYVRVRTYKKVGSTTYYSGWSTYKYVKTK